MSSLIKIAAGELGVQEIKGDAHDKRILAYSSESGIKGIKDDETAWCSIFVNWCCFKAGLQRTNSARARSWESIGKPVDDPRPGDIVIFWREKPTSWKGHVGIFMGFSKNRFLVYCLGGNQKNAVSIQGYEADKVVGYRRLTSEKMETSPKPTLKKGDRGEEVTKLQQVLTELGYDCGSPDGIFGPRTETQLKAFQTAEDLEADGIYGNAAKDKIESIFQS
jgi:uncharacterized protein (TIGR02594 family)